jgi:hypothetical protein
MQRNRSGGFMSESVETKAKKWCIDNGYYSDQDGQGYGTDDVPDHEFHDNFIEIYNQAMADARAELQSTKEKLARAEARRCARRLKS